MAILETLEGDDPEILDNAMPKASAKSWEPDMAEILRNRRTTSAKATYSGIPVRHRIAGAGKATGSNKKARMAPQRCGVAGAQKWGSAGRYVVMGEDLDPVTLEGWLTSLKKGVSAVADTVSKGVRAVGSVQMDIARSVAPVAGTVIGKAAAAYTGNPTALSAGGVDTGSGGLLSSLSSALGIGQKSAAPAVSPSYVPAAVPAASSGIGGIPVLYWVGGGAAVLLLVAVLKK